MKLNKKKILLGVTGSIATYKTPMLVREIQKQGAEVRIVATPSALQFITELVLTNLTHSKVIADMFDKDLQQQGAWHIELAHWCDAMLIAPCSATTLSKLAMGNADNPVSCLALALPKNKPLIIAPAMDFTMYENDATQTNINIMINREAKIIEPSEGELASGLTGKGRLPNYDIIIDNIASILDTPLNNINILITAGGTQEKIDDVRFISNYSSGKMGYAIAKVASNLGANVTLISAKTHIPKPNINNFIQVTSANEMFNAVKENYSNQDVIIMAAAISDYTPINYFAGKIKKNNDELTIKLKQTQDILKWLGENRSNDNKIIVGFALEASNEIENAKKKLNNKQCDLLVLNSIYGEQSGFESDYNTITILDKYDNFTKYNTMQKIDCAKVLLNTIKQKLDNYLQFYTKLS
jgi:phosphopantothenoylcysteine decarboxylase/phosphopantothenate--cysteine ligase